MTELEIAHGMNSAEWRAIALQYVKNPVEAAISPQERRRHYEFEITLQFNGQPLAGVEAGVPPHCAARADHRVRRALPLVPARPVSSEDAEGKTRSSTPRAISAQAQECAEVDEVLITGGDPLVVPNRLETRSMCLQAHAPNIQTIRLGTRVPTQDPDRIDQNCFRLTSQPAHRIEIGSTSTTPSSSSPKSRAGSRASRQPGPGSITSTRC